jgi:hypothetical protein
MLVINEEIKDLPGLTVVEHKWTEMANGERKEVEVVSQVEVGFENRRLVTDALVLPNPSEVLLGAIPLEQMDVLIDPARQCLILHPGHPDMAVLTVNLIRVDKGL